MLVAFYKGILHVCFLKAEMRPQAVPGECYYHGDNLILHSIHLIQPQKKLSKVKYKSWRKLTFIANWLKIFLNNISLDCFTISFQLLSDVRQTIY